MGDFTFVVWLTESRSKPVTPSDYFREIFFGSLVLEQNLHNTFPVEQAEIGLSAIR